MLQPIVSATFAHASLGPEGQWVTNGPQAALRGAAFTVFAEYGVAEDLAFGAQIEARLAERLGAASEGVGETQLFVRRTILRERGWCPEATVLGLLKLPTGNAVGRAALLGTDVLVRTLDPRRARRGKYDERIAAEAVRTKVGDALRRLADLGFVDVLDDTRLRLRPGHRGHGGRRS